MQQFPKIGVVTDTQPELKFTKIKALVIFGLNWNLIHQNVCYKRKLKGELGKSHPRLSFKSLGYYNWHMTNVPVRPPGRGVGGTLERLLPSLDFKSTYDLRTKFFQGLGWRYRVFVNLSPSPRENPRNLTYALRLGKIPEDATI